ncbi:kininogen-1-like [Homarus americanus]|uniref:kininogen-1-like n=1 Tax=Homarus americanus TaxID=6706 RepID=UPI001C46367E|nr:kininogen-1-like [Homarus americanus]
MDEGSEDPNIRVVDNVISAEMQVVAGTNWKLKVTLSWTTCKKEDEVQDLNNCEKDLSKPSSVCDVVIYERSWENFKEVTGMNCTNVEDSRARRRAVGKYSPVDLPDSKVSELAQFAVASMDEGSEDPNIRVVDNVISAEMQVVAGVNWNLKVTMSWTTCKKEDQVQDLNNCEKDLSKPSSVCDVVIYERPWENFKEVTGMNCTNVEDSRARRRAVGMYSPVDLPDSKVSELAQFVVASMDEGSEDPNIRVVDNVISAEMQVVAGANWNLKVTMSWTTCKKEDQVQDLSNCEKDLSKPSSVCDVVIYERPWENFKEVTGMNCTNVEDSRARRRAVGMYSPVDLPDSKVSELAQFVVASMDEGSEDPNIRVVDNVISAEMQVSKTRFVVSGVNWNLKVTMSWTTCKKEDQVQDLNNCEKDLSKPSSVCDVVIYERPWENFKEVTGMNCTNVEDSRARRRAVGMYSPVDLPDSKVSELAQFVVASMDEGSEDPNIRVVDNVISAEMQVVAGANWNLKVTMSWTTCKKDDQVQDLNNCEKDLSKPSSVCDVVIYEKPWENFKEVTGMNCTNVEDSRARRRAVGMYSPVDLPDSKVSELAQFVVASMDEGSEDPNIRVVDNVISAEMQVVAGANWNLKVTMSWTTCKKEDQVQDLNNCEKDLSKPSSVCDVVIYERPWENFKEVTGMNCTNVEHSRARRRAVGMYSPVDLPDSKVSELAQFAVTYG